VRLALRQGVPSLSHEVLVDLFRHCGELAPALLASVAGIDLAHAVAEIGSPDLSQIAPTEYRADAVILLRDHRHAVTSAIVVEVQIAIDPRKHYTWPVYLTNLRAAHDCPVTLLVVAPEPSTARWARHPIETGHAGFTLTPIVIDFANVPRIVDRETALKLPELAVLSTMAHPHLEIARPTVDAISTLPADRTKLYFDQILSAMDPADRKYLEAHMQGYVYQSDFARRYYSQGLAEGLAEGEEKGFRLSIQALVNARLRVISPAEQAAIEAARPEDATAWITALSKARSAASVRAILANGPGKRTSKRTSKRAVSAAAP
jgi:hypothetical protein